MSKWMLVFCVVALAACSDDAGDGAAQPGRDTGGQDLGDARDTGDGNDVAADTGDAADAEADTPADGGDDASDTGDGSDAGDTPDAGDAGDTDDVSDANDAGDAEDTGPDVPMSELAAVITQPLARDVTEVGTSLDFRGTVSDSLHAADTLQVRWISDVAGELFAGPPNRDGLTGFSTDTLTPGWHIITLQVTNPDGQTANAQVRIGICRWADPETFDTQLDGASWRIYGDATWDPGGWLEMTGNAQDRKGAIYNISDIVNPGDVSISFRIWTGGGSGADGFAMSVFDVVDVAELDRLNAEAGTGGALAYGVGGDWGDWEVDGFHVEFDTWHNVFNGNNELHTDPTPENHIGVMTNGDPGTHHLWAEIPTIEDQQWHDVIIQVEGSRVIVSLDGAVVIDGEVEGLNFKGGFIGFSGTTGFFTNFHRFDRLQVLQECLVP